MMKMDQKNDSKGFSSPPSFKNLPEYPGLPKGCTWGLWDQDGQVDELGTLNLLTPDVVKHSAREIQHGISVSLNWSMEKPHIPVFNRQRFAQTIVDNATFSSSQSYDDTLAFNTQSGSQWDGLRHVVHAGCQKLYGGVGRDEISGPNASDVLGFSKWHERGGVVGRGVLIDYVAYAQRHNIAFSPVEHHAISLNDLKTAASEQGVTFRAGDILIVRSGLIKWYNECSDAAERDAFFTNPNKGSIGVVSSPEVVSWIWDCHFSAVAGDGLAWEAVPYPANNPSLHQYLLPLFGMPIGELWDLELLADTCAKLGRYSFFLTSVPLNVRRGVASPPNAVAIF